MSSQPVVWQEKDNADGLSGTSAIGNPLTFDASMHGAFYVEVVVLARTASGVTLRFVRGVTGRVDSSGGTAVLTVEDVSDTLTAFIGAVLLGTAVTVSASGNLLEIRLTLPGGQTASAAYVANCQAMGA